MFCLFGCRLCISMGFILLKMFLLIFILVFISFYIIFLDSRRTHDLPMLFIPRGQLLVTVRPLILGLEFFFRVLLHIKDRAFSFYSASVNIINFRYGTVVMALSFRVVIAVLWVNNAIHRQFSGRLVREIIKRAVIEEGVGLFRKWFKLCSCLGLVLVVENIVGRRFEFVLMLVSRMFLWGLVTNWFNKGVFLVLEEGKVILW
jgi:hypothetical protein